MSQILNEVIAANEKYIDNLGKKSNFALSPARGFAILTCIDAGLDKCF